MLEKFINQVIETNNTSDIIEICAAVIAAAVLGGIVLLTYRLACGEFSFNKNSGIMIFLLPIASSALIILIGDSVATALVVSGILVAASRKAAFVAKPGDTAYMLIGAVAGVASGAALFVPALIFVVVTCIFTGIYTACTSESKKKVRKMLKIEVPESINYNGLFDETLKKYTSAYKLREIRIIGCGTVTELTYAVRIKNINDSKEFLDELRTLNANFKIQLKEFAFESADS